jgi:uncharacterized caspase-like protein
VILGVVVGIDEYSDPRIPRLQSARADAQAVASLLRDHIAPKDRDVQTLIDKAASRAAIVKAIGEALPRKHSREDLVVVYFAGHGSPEQKEPPDRISRYLVASDTEYDQIFATGIGLETDLVSLLERQLSERVVVILDACFSGRAGGRSIFGPHLASRAQFRALLKLRDLDLGYGRAILAACRDDELARESADHGLFTRSFMEVLSEPSKSSTIGLGELYHSVFDKVTLASSGSQHPVLKGTLEGMRLPRFGRQASIAKSS